jgi:hypothetical protein
MTHRGDIIVKTLPTQDLTAAERSSVIYMRIAAHSNDDFKNLFTYIPSGARSVACRRTGLRSMSG